MRASSFFLAVFLAVAIPGLARAAPTAIRYELSVVPQADRTELDIRASWKPETGEAVKVQLPQDYYGSGDLTQYLTVLEGLGGTTVANGKDGKERQVKPGLDGQIKLHYRMSYDPIKVLDISFGPISTPRQVQTFLCQWMLRFGDLDKECDYEISITSAPKGWSLYSSLAPDPRHMRVTKSYNDLISTVLGAGDLAHGTFKVHGKPVHVFLDKNFTLRQDEIIKKAESVVNMQRSWFGDYGQPFYTITISIRPDNIAGTCVSNCFVCFLKKDATEDQVLGLMSHEMLHNWVPMKTHVEDPGEVDRWQWEWYDEGFDDYFSRVVLLESGAITKERFAALVNQDLRNIADNPIRNETYEQVKADIVAGMFSVAHKKLSYYRGAVIASNWNARIRRQSEGKKSLSDWLRVLYAKARYGRLSQSDFHAISKQMGIDSEADRVKFILRGESIQPEDDALGAEYTLSELEFPTFDPGFDVYKSLRSRKIEGLRPDGPAAKAGLVEGEELKEVSNSNRFGNAWKANDPFVAVVRRGGEDVTVRYMPHGPSHKVLQYVKRSAPPRGGLFHT